MSATINHAVSLGQSWGESSGHTCRNEIARLKTPEGANGMEGLLSVVIVHRIDVVYCKLPVYPSVSLD